jgi:L-ascorbate metabolism protein UlaG (beta-lactamase superfamily)
MEIQYFGANAVKISSKKATVVVDDNLLQLGLKSIAGKDDISLYTSKLLPHTETSRFVIDSPGEYELSDASIQGIASRSHIEENRDESATMYRVIVDDVRIAVVGHIYPELSDNQLEALGTIDILIIPVGGNGYTLDGVGAQKIIKKIEPKLVIPTHYADKAIKYEVPQADLEEALKGVAMEPMDTVDSLKTKGLELTDTTKLLVLKRQ